MCVADLSPRRGVDDVAETLNLAMENCADINEISGMKSGLRVLFMAAFRHYRLPIPPHFWLINS